MHSNQGYPQEKWNHSWPDKLGITKFGTEQDNAFSYNSTGAIQDSNKSGHMRALQATSNRKVPYFPNWCVYLESLPFKCDAHAILSVQSNRIQFVTAVIKWFQLRHLGNVRKIAKSWWHNTLAQSVFSTVHEMLILRFVYFRKQERPQSLCLSSEECPRQFSHTVHTSISALGVM